MARRPPPASPACSPPVTSPITCIGRRSRPPAPAAWPRSTRIDTSRLSTRRGTARRAAMALRPEFHRSIGELDPRQWNALGAGANPFTRHEFLLALERTHCVGRATGWEPLYLTLRDGGGLAAAAAAFVKTHSFGEFVFDFAWARAYEGVGRRYYPKLTVGAPFTPATGPRLLVRADLDREALAARLLEGLEERAASHGLSGAHALFLDEPAREACLRRGSCREPWALRRSCPVSRRAGARGVLEARLAAAARLPVSLEQPRLH